MRPTDTQRTVPGSRLEPVLAIVAVVIAAIVVIAVLSLVWYPTTRQPQVVLSNASYVAEACVSVGGGFANRYNWTFTLVNTGSADGSASVAFALDGNIIYYREYVVPQHSQVTENATDYGAIYLTRGACGGSETPSISLASVTGGPAIDVRTVIVAVVGPTATIGFAGAMLGIMQFGAHRRGFSIHRDLGASGLAVALLVVLAAGLFSGVLTNVLMTPYNYPVDWTPAILYGFGASALGSAMFGVAYREAVRVGRVSPPGAVKKG